MHNDGMGNLFGDEDPIDKTIRIKNSPYLVLGVLAAKGQSLDGRDQAPARLSRGCQPEDMAVYHRR